MYGADSSKTVAKLGNQPTDNPQWHCNVSVGSLSAHYVLYLTNMACHDELHKGSKGQILPDSTITTARFDVSFWPLYRA